MESPSDRIALRRESAVRVAGSDRQSSDRSPARRAGSGRLGRASRRPGRIPRRLGRVVLRPGRDRSRSRTGRARTIETIAGNGETVSLRVRRSRTESAGRGRGDRPGRVHRIPRNGGENPTHLRNRRRRVHHLPRTHRRAPMARAVSGPFVPVAGRLALFLPPLRASFSCLIGAPPQWTTGRRWAAGSSHAAIEAKADAASSVWKCSVIHGRPGGRWIGWSRPRRKS